MIEIELNELWMLFMVANGIFDEPKITPKPKSYSCLTELLFEAGFLTQEMHQDLVDFNIHRNLLSHNLFGIKKKKTTKDKTEKIFNRGLHVSGTLPLNIARFIHMEVKKNPKFKKLIEKALGMIP